MSGQTAGNREFLDLVWSDWEDIVNGLKINLNARATLPSEAGKEAAPGQEYYKMMIR